MQLDQGQRGFSFLREGPLDMRMDLSDQLTAYEIVNRFSEERLGAIFREYGEEPKWKMIARAIVEERKKRRFQTTLELARFIESLSRGRGRLHPATLVFQALRIAVNSELKEIELGLTSALKLLSPGGRVGAISFHRLEDRIVKNVFKSAEKEQQVILLHKKPLTPTIAEIKSNPRSRSAKLRFAERL